MNTILDYVAWRGDLPLELFAFNEVDSLILSQLSYINYTGVVGADFEKSVPLKTVAETFMNMDESDVRKILPPNINADTFRLLISAGLSVRFGGVKMCGYAVRSDSVAEAQFAAVTFILSKKRVFVSFRGTDGTLVGWKEDFNMAFMSPVPSQRYALEYVLRVAGSFRSALVLGGHSKGGNLAMYAASFCGTKVQNRIETVYNHDGPGFENGVLNKSEYLAIVNRIRTFLPKSSVVGILFEHRETCTVVESSETLGVLQHDPFTWLVYGKSFVCVPNLTLDSVFVDITLKNWLQQLDKARLEQFIDTLFDVVSATEAVTLADLSENWLKKSGAVLKALSKIEPDTRDAVLKTIHLLFKSARQSVPFVAELMPLKKFTL